MSESEERIAPRLAWPPTKEDLQQLYVDQLLSEAKIAKAYGRETANPRSAAELIGYYLKKYGIGRRNRIEELRRRAEKIVADWNERYPATEGGDPKREENAVQELLKNENLSIEYLELRTKERVRVVMERLYHTRGTSMTDIADLIGNKTSGYVSWLFGQLEISAKPFEEARLQGIHDKVRKYERRPFDGTDEDRAYLLGLAHGDLHVATPWNGVISVSTSTTHPAMVQLFRNSFSQCGHVYLLPRRKYDTQTYEWNLQVILDDSFRFLLLSHEAAWEWVSRKESTLYSYLAGIWDAEGSVEIRENRKVVSIRLPMYNTNLSLVKFIVSKLRTLGYTPWGPYLAKRVGETSTKWGIPLRKDYWKAEVLDLDQSQSLLRVLPLRHREKVSMKAIALLLRRGDRWEGVEHAVKVIRSCINLERDRFVAAARLEYEVRRRRKLLKRDGQKLTQVPLPGLESPPVTCSLIKDVWRYSTEEKYDKILGVGDEAHAIHYGSLCWDDKPCVVICWRCNSRNIASILVHESVHHAILWMDGVGHNEEDPLDDIARFLEANRIRMKEFPI